MHNKKTITKNFCIMKKKLTVAVAILMAGSLTFSSCIGSFGLTNKIFDWNNNMGSKWVNEVVFFAFLILPVYEISLIADGLVINSIEFWTGNNPLADNVKHIEGENSDYLVESNENGYKVTDTVTNETVEFTYNKEENSWAVNGITFLTFIDDEHIGVYAGEGQMVTVEKSQAGLLAYKSMIGAAGFMASK